MDAAEEKDFHSKRQWTSFKAQVLTALSTATFFGVLAKIVTAAVDMAAASSAAVATTTSGAAVATTSAGLLANPVTLAVLGGALVAGTVFTYMAQHEWTDLKVLEDDHLAKRNAECNAIAKAEAKAQEACCAKDHDEHQRADGQRWTDVARASQPSLAASR